MKIFVKAKPKSQEPRVEKIDSAHFVVVVQEPPEKGKANEAIARALASYFDMPFSSVKLVSGFSSRQKTFEIG